MQNKGFMIRNAEGRYSNGGQAPVFLQAGGKIWRSRGHMLKHVAMCRRAGVNMRGWEAVEVLVTPLSSAPIT